VFTGFQIVITVWGTMSYVALKFGNPTILRGQGDKDGKNIFEFCILLRNGKGWHIFNTYRQDLIHR